MNSFSQVPGFYACGRVYSLASFALLEPEISSLQKPFSLMYLSLFPFNFNAFKRKKKLSRFVCMKAVCLYSDLYNSPFLKNVSDSRIGLLTKKRTS